MENAVVSKLITDGHFFWEEVISNYRYRIALPEEFFGVPSSGLFLSQIFGRENHMH